MFSQMKLNLQQQRFHYTALSVLLKRATIFFTITLAFSVAAKADETNSTSTEIQRMDVTVYYEALCPDSIRFIRYKLYDAMINKKLLNYTDLKFVPYGKVSKWINPKTHDEHIACQHGTRECELNALHACIVENNTPFEQMQIIDCLMGRFSIEECSKNLSIDVSAALECKKTRSIIDILKKYGDETELIDLWFVPSIGMNNKFESNLQDRILNQFFTMFCTKYTNEFNIVPKNCPI